jgi:hypothetical protein
MNMSFALTVAQTAGKDIPWFDVFVWLSILLGLAIVALVVSLILRQWYRSSSDSSGAGGFTLQDLREMRDDGRLTEEEFEAARTALIGTVKGSNVERSSSESARE